MNIIRILHVIADGRPGGGTTHVLSLMEDLLNQEHEVHFVTQEKSYALEKSDKLGIDAQGVNFFFSPLDIRVPLKLSRIVRQIKPDLIHVHGSRAAFFLSFASVKGSIPIVYTVHGYHFPHRYPRIRHLGLLAERRASKRARALVLVSEYDHRFSEKWGLLPACGETFVVYNGIEDVPIPAGNEVDLRCVGFLGRMVHQKNPHLFVETLRILSKDGYTGKMVGGGELETDVRIMIKQYGLENTVKVTGALDRLDALREISNVGTVLFPSRWEGLPIAPLEAMSLRVPVVASQVGGIPEIIEDGISGLLVRERDPRPFAEAVVRLTDDHDLRERIIETAAGKVAKRFHRRQTAAAYMSIYQTLLRSVSA